MASTTILPGIPAGGGYRRLAFRVCLIAAGLSFFTGCAEKDFSELQSGIDQRGHYIANVPFYHQGEDSCGPAALASVVSFWGRTGVTVEEIKARIYLPELRGTLPMDMERYLRDAGFRTFSSSGTIDELKTRICRNLPVICLLDLGFSVYRQPHYVTVIGFDDVNRVFITHDGMNANTVIEYDTFMKQWDRGGYWMLVALPPAATSGNKP